MSVSSSFPKKMLQKNEFIVSLCKLDLSNMSPQVFCKTTFFCVYLITFVCFISFGIEMVYSMIKSKKVSFYWSLKGSKFKVTLFQHHKTCCPKRGYVRALLLLGIITQIVLQCSKKICIIYLLFLLKHIGTPLYLIGGCKHYISLALSGPFGPFLARSGSP